MRDKDLDYILKHAVCAQVYYMKQSNSLHNCLKHSIQQFVRKLHDLNRYLFYFPEDRRKHLDQDAIIEILDQAKDPAWHEVIVTVNIDIFELSYKESLS
jgi:hypothetical protein